MSTRTIEISEATQHRLEEAAAKLGASVEEIARRSVEEYLERKQRIQDAADYVLKKNEELYRQLT